MATSKHIKIKLREVNRHLVCRLCRGYYVDATTIAECLHSFCRSCIIKYLEKNSFCPICEVQIHKTKPYLNLRLDKALQDVVYKVVPGLYHNEMKRRREYYAKRREQIPFATPEQCGVEERIIFSPEDSISLSLEYLESDDYESETVSSQSSESGDNPDHLSFPQQLGLIKLKNGDGKTSRRESQDVQDTSTFPKRYLQCPAVVNIGHLKKFIKMKHDLTDKMQVNIMHKKVPLPEHYTLMDVAYIYTWKRNSPLRFFYQIYQTKKHKVKVNPALSEVDSKSRSVPEQSKVSKSVEKETVCEGEITKSPSDVKIQARSNNEKSEIISGDIKEIVNNSETKRKDSVKTMPEIKSEKSVKPENVTVKQQSVKPSDNVKNEPKEGFEAEPHPDVLPRNNKSEKLKLNSANNSENKNKIDCQKRKSGKVENNETKVCETKENDSDNRERLLLNPISGKLESVSKPDHSKSLNGTDNREGKKENEDCVKKDVSAKAQKRSEFNTSKDSKDSKDSKKSDVNLLKSFRKEKLNAGKDGKVEIKNSRGSSLTIIAVPKNEKPPEKNTGNFSVEIKADKKVSEYDFDGSSPPRKIIPLQEFSKSSSKGSKYLAEHRDKWLSKESKNSWMSLKEFREKIMKENDSSEENAFMKSKKKVVPSLFKINSEENKTPVRKCQSLKNFSEKTKERKTSSAVFNLKTPKEVSQEEVKLDVIPNKTPSSAPVSKTESKDGECSTKLKNEKKQTAANISDSKTNSEPRQQTEVKADSQIQANRSSNESLKTSDRINAELETPKSGKNSKISNEKKNESFEAIDLSKAEVLSKSEKNPLENLMDLANKSSLPKSDEKMIKALLSAAQKQSIEPLLKIPQYTQILKNSLSLGSTSSGKNFSNSPNEISQALQFLENLGSDVQVLETKNKLNPNSVLEQFAQKSGNLEPYQQLYQQKIDLIRRLKRQQQVMPNDSDGPPKKQIKLSPTTETKKKVSTPPEQNIKTSPTPDEIAQFKSSMDRTLSQIQLMELQSQMIAAHSYKNLPALLQFYTRPPNFTSGPTSPSKSNQQKIKPPSSHSPNKSPQSLTSSTGNTPLSAPGSDSSLFNHQNYTHLINAGLNSEMTYHQMFQSYLNQQEQMNQVKLAQTSKKPVKFNEVSSKCSTEKHCAPQTNLKVQELNNSQQQQSVQKS